MLRTIIGVVIALAVVLPANAQYPAGITIRTQNGAISVIRSGRAVPVRLLALTDYTSLTPERWSKPTNVEIPVNDGYPTQVYVRGSVLYVAESIDPHSTGRVAVRKFTIAPDYQRLTEADFDVTDRAYDVKDSRLLREVFTGRSEFRYAYRIAKHAWDLARQRRWGELNTLERQAKAVGLATNYRIVRSREVPPIALRPIDGRAEQDGSYVFRYDIPHKKNGPDFWVIGLDPRRGTFYIGDFWAGGRD